MSRSAHERTTVQERGEQEVVETTTRESGTCSGCKCRVRIVPRPEVVKKNGNFRYQAVAIVSPRSCLPGKLVVTQEIVRRNGTADAIVFERDIDRVVQIENFDIDTAKALAEGDIVTITATLVAGDCLSTDTVTFRVRKK